MVMVLILPPRCVVALLVLTALADKCPYDASETNANVPSGQSPPHRDDVHVYASLTTSQCSCKQMLIRRKHHRSHLTALQGPHNAIVQDRVHTASGISHPTRTASKLCICYAAYGTKSASSRQWEAGAAEAAVSRMHMLHM